MTNMSDVSEVIDAAEAEGTSDVVSKALALIDAPEKVAPKIKPFIDRPSTTGDGEIIANITPLQYPVRDLHIAALHHFLDGIQFAVETPEGMAEAKQVALRLSKLKTAMKDTYTAWNSPIMDMTADARAKRDYVIEEVDSILLPIKAQIDAQTAREAEERNRKARIETERISAHTAALKVLTDMPSTYLSASSETIGKVIGEISSFDYLSRRDWQEYLPAATDAIRANIETLKQHLENAKAREAVARMEAENKAAEQKRAHEAELRERIHNIELAPTTVVGATSEAIQRKIARLDQTDPASFENLAPEATAAIENARNVLQTMLDGALKAEAAQRQADADAAELAAFRAQAERQKQEQQQANQRAEDEARQEAERAQREQEEAARIARERAEAIAETLLALLIEARPHVDECDADLLVRIDAAIAAAQGE